MQSGGMLGRATVLGWEGSALHVDKAFTGPEVTTVKSFWHKTSIWPRRWWFSDPRSM